VPPSPSVTGLLASRSVILTGHTGFKGPWLTLWLSEIGAHVSGYSLPPPTDPNLFDALDGAALLVRHVLADVRDRDRLAGAMDEAAPEVIVHLAARTTVRQSYTEPVETLSTNVLGTLQVLEAVRTVGRRCAVVVVTSDKCYHNDESGRPLMETDRMGGADPYSASKAAAELAVDAYRASHFPPAQLDRHGVALATARAGNVIGGGDWTPDGIVADIVRAPTRREPVRVRNPSAIRPWQHVLEPLDGYLTLATHLIGPRAAAFCRGWNFGPRPFGEATVAALVERFLDGWGEGRWIDESRPDQLHEAGVLRLSVDAAINELGWHPRWGFEEAVARTVRWYSRYVNGLVGARAACVDDIAAYSLAGPPGR